MLQVYPPNKARYKARTRQADEFIAVLVFDEASGSGSCNGPRLEFEMYRASEQKVQGLNDNILKKLFFLPM